MTPASPKKETLVLSASDPTACASAVSLLCAGEVVATPTETVYGLAGDASSDLAVSRIFSAKKRPFFDPLIVHISQEMASLDKLDAADIIHKDLLTLAAQKQLQALISAFWPGPMTLVLPKGNAICDLACNGLSTVAIRCPKHPFFQRILKESGLYLAAPSANTFGHVSPTRAEHVLNDLAGKIPLIIDADTCELGLESTILSLGLDDKITLLRKGALALETIAKILGYNPLPANAEPGQLFAPGMLERHYAPRTPLFLLGENNELLDRARLRSMLDSMSPKIWRVGLLHLGQTGNENLLTKDFRDHFPDVKVQVPWSFDLISSQESKNSPPDIQVARQLFLALRLADAQNLDLLFAERSASELGLWPAVNDRLWKARYQGDLAP
jgi:L-threonylcarbamoyladenylate synthase